MVRTGIEIGVTVRDRKALEDLIASPRTSWRAAHSISSETGTNRQSRNTSGIV